jgi:L-rhamnose mutarotase
MVRKAFIIQAKEGMAEEYERRHNPIWSDLEAEIRSVGIRNYSIFLHEPTRYLFCYFEVEDPEKLALLASSPVCQRWWAYMTEALEVSDPSAKKGWEEELRQVFHLS